MSVQVRAVESRSARKILISATELAKKKKKLNEPSNVLRIRVIMCSMMHMFVDAFIRMQTRVKTCMMLHAHMTNGEM